MFKIDYVYQKGGSPFSCHYPSPENVKHNIFVIKGKNDQGKSSILQMIALGLYGEYSEDIDKMLKDRMRRLIAEDVDKCEFEFSITSKDGKIKLYSQLKNHEIKVLVNDKPKSRTYIEDNFKILYDIPEEPIKKLTSALRSMENNLGQYEKYTQKYLDEAKKKIEEIANWDEREERLKEEESKRVKQKSTLERLIHQLEDVEKDFDELQKAHVVIYFEGLYSDFQDICKQIEGLGKRIKELKTAGAGGGNRQYRENLDKFRIAITQLKITIDTSKQLSDRLMTKEKRRMAVITAAISNLISPKDLNSEQLQEWYKFFDTIRKNLEANQLYKKKLPEEDYLDLYGRLLKILNDFIGIDATIPGTNGKNISEFITELETSKKKLEIKMSEKLTLNNAIDACTSICAKLGDVAIAHKMVPKIEVTSEDDLDDVEQEKGRLEETRERLSKELSKLEDLYNPISEDEKSKLRLRGAEVKKEYEERNKERNNLKINIKDLEIKIGVTVKHLEELRKTKKPFKELNKKKLESLYKISYDIMRKISSWREYTKSIDLEEMSVKKIEDTTSKNFCMALGDYLADVLNVIYFENKAWNVKKVDFIKKCYEVEDRRAIGFLDIGTGHTALNALLARVKQDYSGKNKILLFDEIGHMDEDNITRLLNEIKRQVASGEVLFALLTQTDNSLERVIMDPVEL